MPKQRTASQRGKYVRSKGAAFERDIANKIKHIYPDAKRHLESQAAEAAKGIDLDNTGEFGIQCKAYAKYAPITKIQEVKHGTPVLITKGNNLKPVACMYLDDWIKLLEKVNEK